MTEGPTEIAEENVEKPPAQPAQVSALQIKQLLFWSKDPALWFDRGPILYQRHHGFQD